MSRGRWPSRGELEAAASEAREVAARMGLGFRRHHGFAGRVLGPGIGSSIEYEDHRPFVAGDDPRYLDWAALARSGQLVSKVYREEVAPQVDVVIDVSRSMFLGEAKRRRSLELVYWAVLAARAAHAAVVIQTIAGAQVTRHGLEAFLEHRWLDTPLAADVATLDLRRASWRPRSMRVVVSDLLFPGVPQAVLRPVGTRAGGAALLAPYAEEEARPELSGACRLVDCETGAARVEHVDARTAERFAAAYLRHFDLWRGACRKASVSMIRVTASGMLSSALADEAVVPWT